MTNRHSRTRAGISDPYGGRFVPEVLMAPLEELEQAYLRSAQRSGVSSRS